MKGEAKGEAFLPKTPSDPDLAAVHDAWPSLPPAICDALANLSRGWSKLSPDRQAGMLAMIQALAAFVGTQNARQRDDAS